MIKALYWALTVVFAASVAYADDYIIKLKNSNTHFSFLANATDSKTRALPVSFGQYVTIHADPQADREWLEAIAGDPNVAYIEKDVVYYLLGAPVVDPMWNDQWGLKNTGSNNWSKGPEGEDIQAEKAWRLSKGSPDLIVAVIDSGLQLDHPDLAGNVFENVAEKNGRPGVDDDGNGYVDDLHGWDFIENDNNPNDLKSHGTHVSGLIGARHNAIGVAGVMDQVKILPLKFIGEHGGKTSDAVLAIQYAVKMGAKVINCSWGGGEFSQALLDALRMAAQHGVYVVTAAGNSKEDNDKVDMFPANYDSPNIVSVGATNGKGVKAEFSNFGAKKVHLFAPGSMIISTMPDGKWGWKSGSSMAAPLVSGALGLLLSVRPELASAGQLGRGIQLLIDSAERNEKLEGLGRSGRLDLNRLLDMAMR